MSESRRNLGFPSNQIKGDDWLYSSGCGGMGAGECKLPAGFSYIFWEIKVNPFSMHNSKLVLHNDLFKAYLNSPVGTCANNAGNPVDIELLLFYKKPTGDLDKSKATGRLSIPAGITLPYEVEFDAINIPQPSHPDYERKIWAVIDLGQTGRMVNGIAQNTEVMQTIKLNWEGQP